MPSRPESAAIVNFYEKINKKHLTQAFNPNFHLHGIKLPFRMVVVAPSGSGKTNFLMNLLSLFSRGQGTFNSIHIITRNKSEPLYDWLAEVAPQIRITEGLGTIPNLDDYDKSVNHLVVFDDLVLAKDQSRIAEMYVRARNRSCSVVYLSQSYYPIPKMIRVNCSYASILKLSGQKDTNMVLSELGMGLTRAQLQGVYREATAQKLMPLLVDVEAPPETRFRKGFDTILDPNDYS